MSLLRRMHGNIRLPNTSIRSIHSIQLPINSLLPKWVQLSLRILAVIVYIAAVAGDGIIAVGVIGLKQILCIQVVDLGLGNIEEDKLWQLVRGQVRIMHCRLHMVLRLSLCLQSLLHLVVHLLELWLHPITTVMFSISRHLQRLRYSLHYYFLMINYFVS